MENIPSKLDTTHIQKTRLMKTKHSPQFSSASRSIKQIKTKKPNKLSTQKTSESMNISNEPSKPKFHNLGLDQYKKNLVKDEEPVHEELNKKPVVSLNRGIFNDDDNRKTPNFGLDRINLEGISPVEADSVLMDSIFSFTSKERNYIKSVEINIKGD